MEFLQSIDPHTAILITVGCALLCLVAVVGFVLIQFVGFGFDIIFGVLGFLGDIIAGGPIAWCGCLVMIFGSGICGLITFAFASVLPNCGTPDAVNLCRFLGT